MRHRLLELVVILRYSLENSMVEKTMTKSTILLRSREDGLKKVTQLT